MIDAATTEHRLGPQDRQLRSYTEPLCATVAEVVVQLHVTNLRPGRTGKEASAVSLSGSSPCGRSCAAGHRSWQYMQLARYAAGLSVRSPHISADIAALDLFGTCSICAPTLHSPAHQGPLEGTALRRP